MPDAVPEALLERRGSYRLAPAADHKASVYCDLEVDRNWASLRVGSIGLDPGPAALDHLEAAGFRRPDPNGRSRSARAWLRSWAFVTPADRTRATTEMLAATRQAFRLEPDAPVAAIPGPSGRRGDPGAAIVVVLLALYTGYAVIAGWLVLAAWDVLLPARAHPQAAIWAQVAGPIIAILALLTYTVVWPEVRLRRAAARRAPTASEIDREVPGTTLLSVVVPPVVLVVLLLFRGG